MDWTSNVGAAGEWFNQLPDGMQQTLINAAGEVVAAPALTIFGIVGKGVAALLAKKKESRAEQQTIETAIQAALGDALLDTLTPLAQTPDELRHALGDIFGPWLKTPAVSGELAKVIAPRSETGASAVAPNLAVLESVFTQKLGFKATDDALGAPFAQIVADLVENFGIQAAWQPALRPAVQVRVARTTNVLLRRLAPLDLNMLIQEHYLPRVSEDSNLLPLVKSDPRERKAAPRLQQVFVDLRVEDEPELSQLLLRLGLPRWRQTQVLQALHAAWSKQQRNAPQFDERMPGAEAGKPATWAEKLAALDQEARDELAAALHVAPTSLAIAHHRLTPLEKLTALSSPQMVLLGDPGSGKSTVTRRIAALLAHLAGDDAAEPLEDAAAVASDQILAAFGRRLLPIRVVMSQWAQHPPQTDGCAGGCAAYLIEECKRVIGRLCGAGPDLLHQEIANRFFGKHPTVFVLLDGLDEVTDADQRYRLLHSVREFCKTYPAVPLLITCRERPWAALQVEMNAGRLPVIDLPVAKLQRLTSDAIDLFVARWHAEMEYTKQYTDADKSAACQAQILAALRNPERQDLADMAGTPLLLTMMVLVNYERELPDSRVELYERLVNQLLFEWEQTKLEDQRKKTGLEELLPKQNDRDVLQRQINRLAFNIHDPTQHRDTVDIPAHRLHHFLQFAFTSDPDDPELSAAAKAWADQVQALITARSGLINEVHIGQMQAKAGQVDKQSVYQFAHRTFQEYLAARWMATAPDSFNLIAQRIDQPEWREAILLAIGYQCTYREQGRDQTLFALSELWPEQLDAPAEIQRLLLLGEAYVHLFGADGRRSVEDRTLARKLQATALADLLHLMQKRPLPAPDRLQAALLLDDLRKQVDLAPVDLDVFIAVPNTDFYIGKYPVTNRQFKRFVDAGGYGDARRPRPTWWSEQGWDARRLWNWTVPRYFNDGRFNRPAQPVVGVSWYEAEAYCNWLNDPDSGAKLPAGTQAQLPTREQWMSAARNGKTTAPDAAVDYPWAGRFDPALANTQESNFGQTTPVDMYPDGATPAGVCDLAGNVWEWTADANPEYRDAFWVKGGSYYSDAGRARASAADLGGFRAVWNDYFGFRLVCVPISHG